jgi:membrane associated rhomboid family serine protease
MQTPAVIRHLILVNLIMFVATLFNQQVMFDWFAMHFPENPLFKPWQVITHMFMHGGTMHILFNMYAVWAFGTPIVYHYGEKKFLVFFLISGIGAVMFYTGIQYWNYYQYIDNLIDLGVPLNVIETVLKNPGAFGTIVQETGIIYHPEVLVQFKKLVSIYNTPMVGASGAVYGILVAFGFFYPRAKLMLIFLPYPIEARYFIPLLILGDIFMGITNVFHTPIAHFAHVGGALTGLILLWLWRKKRNEYYF